MDRTRIGEAELLESQLAEALAEVRREEGHAFEVVALAGLCERLAEAPASLAAVEEWLDGEGAVLLADEIPRLELDRRVDELIALPDDAHDERVDGTFAIDELSAGLTFCGSQARIAPLLALLDRAICATPEPWCALSPLASRILERAAPVDDDPAGAIWRTIEATVLMRDEREATPSVRDVRAHADAAPWIPRLALPPPPVVARAASRLTPDHPELMLRLGDVAEVVYTRTAERRDLFLEVFRATDRVTAARDGRPIELRRLQPTSWTCPAEPGLYVFHIDGHAHVFEIG